MYFIGNKSLGFIAVTLGTLGMVLVFQACLQVSRITGDLSMVGAEYIKGLVHEFVPSIAAQMLACRVGAGIAAEIGSMVVTEQVDALRMNGVEPVVYLVVPRFIASVVMTMVLYLFGLAVCITTGALSAYYSFHVNPQVFVDFGRVGYATWPRGSSSAPRTAPPSRSSPATAASSPAAAPRASARATTRAVIGAAFACIVLDFIISGLAYFTLQAGDAGPKACDGRGNRPRRGRLRHRVPRPGEGLRRQVRPPGLDLRVRRGEVMFIIGTSGVGKSVTIKHLIGLLRPDEGECWFGGRRVDQLSEAELFPVRQEARHGVPELHALRLDDAPRERRPAPAQAPPPRRGRGGARGHALPRAVQLGGFAHRSPAEVGDGIRKRVAIARALTLDPEAVLFDEPTTGLDPVSARRVDRLIRRLADELKVTCVVVSHDLTSIFGVADRICFIYRGAATSWPRPRSSAPPRTRWCSSSSPDARRARWRRRGSRPKLTAPYRSGGTPPSGSPGDSWSGALGSPRPGSSAAPGTLVGGLGRFLGGPDLRRLVRGNRLQAHECPSRSSRQRSSSVT